MEKKTIDSKENKDKPKEIPLEKLPCWTCKDRYSIHCPTCDWNKKGKVRNY